MNENIANFLLFSLGAIVMSIIFVISVGDFRRDKEIVSHGCAQYNSKTAEFEWLDTLTKDTTP